MEDTELFSIETIVSCSLCFIASIGSWIFYFIVLLTRIPHVSYLTGSIGRWVDIIHIAMPISKVSFCGENNSYRDVYIKKSFQLFDGFLIFTEMIVWELWFTVIKFSIVVMSFVHQLFFRFIIPILYFLIYITYFQTHTHYILPYMWRRE